MSALEEGLRRALDGGDARNPEFRLSIYQASERALEKMLADRAVPAEQADMRRHALADAISRIEDEFDAGTYAGLAEAGGAHPDGDFVGGDPYDAAADAENRAGSTVQETHADSQDLAPPRPGILSRPALVGVGVALFLVILLYIVSTVFQSGETPPATEGAATGQTGAAQTGADIAWLNVFSGGNIETLSTPEGGRVEAITANGREAVRMQSPQGQQSEVMLAVGPGLVGEIAGATVRVELTAGSPDSGTREFSVRCLFASNSICDRQRFVTSMQEEAFVFDVAVPSDAATPATLAIAPGVGGDGSDLDLFAVRMRVIG